VKSVVVPDGALVLDTSSKLTAATIAEVVKYVGPNGQKPFGIFRYVSLYQVDFTHDIDPLEAARITGAGLALGLVQHCLAAPPGEKGWTATAQLGSIQGTCAGKHANLVGYPRDSMLAPDDEDIEAGDAVGWANAWEESANWDADLLYTGFAPGMTPEELYELPQFHCYWGAAGAWDVAVCGVAMRQHYPSVEIGGVAFDWNIASADKLGRRVVMATGDYSSAPTSFTVTYGGIPS
jgi:hypothetical protein